jgi:hypothetical protein
MKAILLIFLTFSLYSCTNLVGQKQDEEFLKDQELMKLMNQFSATSANNQMAQGKADNKAKQIVTKAVETIVTLKDEIKALKLELNEKNDKLNGIINDTGSKFKLLPISNY